LTDPVRGPIIEVVFGAGADVGAMLSVDTISANVSDCRDLFGNDYTRAYCSPEL
jgi:hypothetical protein